MGVSEGRFQEVYGSPEAGQHWIPSSFPNPWEDGLNIHMIICPSHQLKNMVAQLYASRPGGAKVFEMDGVQFGWKSIVDLLVRERQNVKDGLARLVPDLKPHHVFRDAWTRLNVKPAKVMQQPHLLAALYSFFNSDGISATIALSTEKCHRSVLVLLHSINLFKTFNLVNRAFTYFI
eukprot:Lithocolla_globosa_v1_NODE_2002_length_2215_cov_2.562037.p2 type:complete len:177 gc:universal NODE_2002_length_2215_cov_2.562037:716-186(-)